MQCELNKNTESIPPMIIPSCDWRIVEKEKQKKRKKHHIFLNSSFFSNKFFEIQCQPYALLCRVIVCLS